MVSLVLTVTVSLAIVCVPTPDGMTSTFTVPSVVKREITEATTELTVVEAVAAETVLVMQNKVEIIPKQKPTHFDKCVCFSSRLELFFIVFYFLF